MLRRKKVEEMNPWFYKGVPIENLSDLTQEPIFGFIYKITCLKSGKSYIGKKQVKSVQKKKLGVKELEQVTDKRLKKYKIVEKESDWKTYHGSCQELKEDIKTYGYTNFKREILQITFSKKSHTYYECKALFTAEVLEHPDELYNRDILGKFHSIDLKIS